MPSDTVARIEASLIALVRRANDPRGNKSINLAAGVDIDRAASVMLARVEELEPARLSDLAEAAGVETSTASRQVARLVDDGLVERSADPNDGRASAHRLTDAGRSTRSKLVVARRDWFDDVLADFDDAEREQFAGLLERFVERMP
jgi:DNA-binding MarR family transcriptional regulator